MNKLDTTATGGFPFQVDDLRWMDEAYRTAFADIIAAITGGSLAVLHGCVVTYMGTYHRVTEGAIAYAGEIWHVDEHNIAWAQEEFPDPPNWVMYEQPDAAGNKTFKDGIQHNTYAIRRAKIAMPEETVTGAIHTLSVELAAQMSDLFLLYSKAEVELKNSSEVLSGSEMHVVRTRDVCVIQGQVRCPAVTTTGTVALTVPVGFRPSTPISGYLALKITGGSTWAQYRFLLDREGDLYVYSETGTQSVDMYLSLSFVRSR